MVSELKVLYGPLTDALTITLASIGIGAGRISTQFDNTSTRYKQITIYARIESGATGPTAGEVYKFYIIKDDGNSTVYRSDGLGTTDAAVSVEPPNANFLFSIVVTGGADTAFYGDFVLLDPGRAFSIVFWNDTSQVISTTEADSFIHIIGENLEGQ